MIAAQDIECPFKDVVAPPVIHPSSSTQAEGLLLGNKLGCILGSVLGPVEDSILGSEEGSELDSKLGPLLGSEEGSLLGSDDGSLLGSEDGSLLGSEDATTSKCLEVAPPEFMYSCAVCVAVTRSSVGSLIKSEIWLKKGLLM